MSNIIYTEHCGMTWEGKSCWILTRCDNLHADADKPTPLVMRLIFPQRQRQHKYNQKENYRPEVETERV